MSNLTVGAQTIVVVLGYGLDPELWRLRYQAGRAWEVTPYGYGRASGNFAVKWANDHPEKALTRIVRQRLARMLGFDVVHVWRNRSLLADADVIWTHTEKEHLAVAFLKKLRRSRYSYKTVAQTVWLWDDWPRLSRARKWAFRKLLLVHEIEVVHSNKNKKASEESVPGRVVTRIPFGSEGPSPGKHRNLGARPKVFAAGNDRDRDWPMLAEVARMMPHVDFSVASKSKAVQRWEWPPNVSVTDSLSINELSAAYQDADVVALPLKQNHHASGATVVIESLSAGCEIVVSDAGGIDEYVANAAVSLIPVGEASAFAEALCERLTGMKSDRTGFNRKAYFANGLTQADYVRRYESITRWLLGEAPWDEDVEKFVPMHEVRRDLA